MEPKARWGVLGTTNMQVDPLLQAISSTANAEVYAIAGDRFGSLITANHTLPDHTNIIKYYHSYEELLNDPHVDIVYIRLPINLYCEWSIKAASHKKHVLCEQPVAMNASEIKQVIDACQENKVIFHDAFLYDFHPQHEKVKELIRDQVIGDVRMMRSSYSFYLGDQERQAGSNPSVEEGVLYALGPSCVNSIRHILGSEPTSVVAYGVTDRYGVHRTVSGILKFANNVHAMFDCSFDTVMRNEYEVIGTKGTITASFAYRPDWNEGKGVLVVRTETSTYEIVVNDDQYIRAVEHICECLLHGTKRPSPWENTWKNMKVIDAVFDSLNNSSVVSKVQVVTREVDDWGAECGIAALLRR